MRQRARLLAAAVAAATALSQAAEVRVETASDGPWEVLVADAALPDSASTALSFRGKSGVFDLAEPAGKVVILLDLGSGRAASSPATKVAAAKAWRPAQAEFVLAGRVRVVVRDKAGARLANGFVRLSSGGVQRERLVGQDGSADFRFVKAGPAKLAVVYRDAEGVERRVEQSASVVAAKDPATLAVELPHHLTQPAGGSSPPGSRKPAAWPNLLAGVVVAGAAGYALYRFVLRQPEKLKSALESAGIPVADEPAARAAPPPPVPQPLQPIVLEPAPAGVAPSAAPAAANPRLVAGDGSVTLLEGRVVRVGRDPGAELSLPGESSVSRSHAQVEAVDGGYLLTDLGSTNGTFLNGRRVDAPALLRPGDRVQFGAASFRFEE